MDNSYQDYYSTAYFKKPEESFENEDRVNKSIEILSKYSNCVFLDLGCGNGNITKKIQMAIKPLKTYGIDISSEAVELAKNKGIIALTVDFNQSKLPFDNGYFDLIYCGEVIEHIFNTDFLIEEIHRVLKINGVLVLSTPNLSAWFNRLALLFGFQPSVAISLRNPELGKPFSHAFLKRDEGGVEAHIRFFTKRALLLFLTMNHFKILNTIGSHYGHPPDKHFIHKFMYYVDNLFTFFPSFARVIIIEAKKIE